MSAPRYVMLAALLALGCDSTDTVGDWSGEPEGRDAPPPSRLAEIEARLKAATPGPWAWWRDPSLVEDGVYAPKHPDTQYDADGKLVDACTVCRGMTGPTREANAQFIASAPEDVAFLLSLVRVESPPPAGPWKAQPSNATQPWPLLRGSSQAGSAPAEPFERDGFECPNCRHMAVGVRDDLCLHCGWHGRLLASGGSEASRDTRREGERLDTPLPPIHVGAGSAGSPEPSEAAIEAAHRRLMASTAQDEDDAREDVRWILRAAYKVQFGAASPSSPEPTVVNPSSGYVMPMRDAWVWACARVQLLESALRGNSAALEVWRAEEGAASPSSGEAQ